MSLFLVLMSLMRRLDSKIVPRGASVKTRNGCIMHMEPADVLSEDARHLLRLEPQKALIELCPAICNVHL